MPHIPRDEVQELWNHSHEKSWFGISHVLESHFEDHRAIGNDTVKMMINMANDMEHSGQPFPQNVDELYNIINENVGAEDY